MDSSQVPEREEDMSEQAQEGIDVEAAVRERYSAGARAAEAALCCPTSYDPQLLAAIDAVSGRLVLGIPTRALILLPTSRAQR